MTLTTQWIDYGPQGHHRGYLAYPSRARLPLPAVLVLQEIWGVDKHITDVTHRLASAGYAAFAPDLYMTDGKRPPLISTERVTELQAFMNGLPANEAFDPAKRAAAMATHPADVRERLEETLAALMGGIAKGLTPHLPTVTHAVQYLREHSDVTHGQKVASVGFCMGGGLSALLACHDPKLAGAVVFYGSAPTADLVPNIRCPIAGFYGGLDERITATVPAFEKLMKEHNKAFTAHIYPAAHHAFFNETRPVYDVGASRDAFAKTLDFLLGAMG